MKLSALTERERRERNDYGWSLRNLHARKLGYSLGFTLSDDAVERLARIPAHAWTVAYDDERTPRDGHGSPRPPACWSCPDGRRGCG
jgi:hypothetical protein